MVTKTTIEMAREAAGDDWGLFQEFMPEIHRLAELVRADERARMAEQPAQQCWKCGDMDAAFQAKCDVPACGMKEQP